MQTWESTAQHIASALQSYIRAVQVVQEKSLVFLSASLFRARPACLPLCSSSALANSKKNKLCRPAEGLTPQRCTWWSCVAAAVLVGLLCSACTVLLCPVCSLPWLICLQRWGSLAKCNNGNNNKQQVLQHVTVSTGACLCSCSTR
jgi:hypothetical protein